MSKRIARNPDLHGFAPDHADTALLLVDVINDLEFVGGEKLLRPALSAARQIAKLKQRAKRAGVPVIYVNDNFGRWKSDFRRLVRHCLDQEVRGRALAELLEPEEDDYFVLKPKHSGFFSTSLSTLLEYLGASTLIIVGFAGNLCVLYTANDAYMRDFRLFVPSDCVASESQRDNRYALEQMTRFLKADTRRSETIRLSTLAAEKKPATKRTKNSG